MSTQSLMAGAGLGLVRMWHRFKATAAGRRSIGALEVARPQSGARSALEINGWAFHRGGAEIERVEISIDGTPVGSPVYGLERPDIVGVFGNGAPLRCGFRGRIPLKRPLLGQIVAVDITWRTGDRDVFRRRVDLPDSENYLRGRAPAAKLTVEQSLFSDERLIALGWGRWAAGTSPIWVVASIGGRTIGRTRACRSRPDLASASKVHTIPTCGFRLDVALPAGTPADTPVDFCLDDDHGHQAAHQTLTPLAPPQARGIVSFLEEYHVRYGRPPAILDTSSRFPLNADADGCAMFRPLESSDHTLHYAPRSIDAILIEPSGATKAEGVRACARDSVLVLDGDRADVTWLSEPARRWPSVSVLIPVYGGHDLTRHCLAQLQSTIPAGIDTEILVVDDASPSAAEAELMSVSAAPHTVRFIRQTRQSGFGASCNAGAGAATGDVLVFLNNDTLPQPGWLPPLLSALQQPGVGAVGAKLVYPDGTLQEAGGIVFNDGSAWNFGNGADPDHPLFSAVREVDYCSAAALATHRSLFAELGGFDPQFAPAYYEDTDYCFAVRQRGLRVLMQPACRVIHFEGATAGRDELSGIKKHQVINRGRFVRKWAETLAARPTPMAVSEAAWHQLVAPASVSRILVWSPVLPEFDRESGSRRLYDFITYLRDEDWDVSLIAEDAGAGARYVEQLQQRGVRVYAGAETSWAAAEFLPDPGPLLANGRFDVVLFQFWWVAERHLARVRELSPASRVIVDSVDLHFIRHLRRRFAGQSSGMTPSSIEFDETEIVREFDTYANADQVLTVSPHEATLIDDILGKTAFASVVPDAEQIARSEVPMSERVGILFLGNFRHTPNVDALAYLARDIVPLLPPDLLQVHPILVVGNGLTDEIIETTGSRRQGIMLVGWVPSVEPYVKRARMLMAPLRFGAGTNRKLIQAALAGTPIVTTRIGLEGLGLQEGTHALGGESATELAAHVVRLAHDADLWSRLSAEAERLVAPRHSPAVARDLLRKALGCSRAARIHNLE